MSPCNRPGATAAPLVASGGTGCPAQPAGALIYFSPCGPSAPADGLHLRSLKRASTSGAVCLSRVMLGLGLVAWLPATPPTAAQSLWKADSSRALIADRKAHAVGDLVTILVQENNTATKDNSTKTSKASAIDASISSFLYSPAASGLLTKGGQLPALKLKSDQSFDGGGKINNKETITARISVRVVDVLPNQNLVIEGRRTTSFANETQDAVLRGVIRPDDIAPNNTIYSYNIADATIKYVSSGTITDNQRKGWFTRIWEKLTPF